MLTYGLDTLTLTEKQICRVDTYYLKSDRRIINIKASFYSRISHHVVWRTAGYPNKPSYFLLVVVDYDGGGDDNYYYQYEYDYCCF